MKGLWRKEWLVYGKRYLPACIVLILLYLVLMSAGSFPPVVDLLPVFTVSALPAVLTMYKDAESGWYSQTAVMCRKRDVLLVKIGIALIHALIVFIISWIVYQRYEGALAGALCTLAAGCLGILIGSFRMSSSGWQFLSAAVSGLTCLLYASPVSMRILSIELVNAGNSIPGIPASDTVLPLSMFRFCGVPLLTAGICIILTVILADRSE